jgi:hypothetical protein
VVGAGPHVQLSLVALAVWLSGVHAATELDGTCSKFQAKLEWLHVEISSVKAEALGSRCLLSNQSEARVGSDAVQPQKQPIDLNARATATADVTQRFHQPTGDRMPRDVSRRSRKPARRSADPRVSYAVHCWAAGSAFADPACNCLGHPAHPKLGLRRTIRIVVASWYATYNPPITRRMFTQLARR